MEKCAFKVRSLLLKPLAGYLPTPHSPPVAQPVLAARNTASSLLPGEVAAPCTIRNAARIPKRPSSATSVLLLTWHAVRRRQSKFSVKWALSQASSAPTGSKRERRLGVGEHFRRPRFRLLLLPGTGGRMIGGFTAFMSPVVPACRKMKIICTSGKTLNAPD